LENIFGWGVEDPITPRIEQVIQMIESTCRGVIGGRGTLYSAINIKIDK
jgi:hypothetical protein